MSKGLRAHLKPRLAEVLRPLGFNTASQGEEVAFSDLFLRVEIEHDRLDPLNDVADVAVEWAAGTSYPIDGLPDHRQPSSYVYLGQLAKGATFFARGHEEPVGTFSDRVAATFEAVLLPVLADLRSGQAMATELLTGRLAADGKPYWPVDRAIKVYDIGYALKSNELMTAAIARLKEAVAKDGSLLVSATAALADRGLGVHSIEG